MKASSQHNPRRCFCSEPILDFPLDTHILLLPHSGAILELLFKCPYKDLPRIRVECDMATQGLVDTSQTLYRHSFSATGCAGALYSAHLVFSNDQKAGGVLRGVQGATAGCDRVRLFIRRSPDDTFELTEFRLITDGCKPAYWMVRRDKRMRPQKGRRE